MKLKQRNFPFTKQPDAMDCGPACLSMISEYYGKRYSLEHLHENGESILNWSRTSWN